jgi:hypothetical protein
MRDRGRFESLVISLPSARQHIRFNLIRIGEAIHLVEQANHSQHFAQAFVVQPQPLHGGRVRVDSVRTAVGHGNGQGNDLLG